MGFKSNSSIVIDDSLVGIQAGYEAGMQTLFFNRQGIDCPYPSVISFNDMHQLPSIIKQLNKKTS